jgi:SAM-dependent methyltransferase
VERTEIVPKKCPICGVDTNYTYNITEADDKEALWYRCSCGIVFQEDFPCGGCYDEKYHQGIDQMKEGDKRLSHSAYTYANIIEELTYGRMMLDVGYCSTKNMDFFKERGWLTWGVDVNNDIGGEKNLYRGDFMTFDFDIPANTDDLKELAGGDKFKRTFDLIWMNHVLEHFNDPLAALHKAINMLSETGVLFVGVPDADFIMKTGPSGYGHFKKDEHYTLWTEDTLKREVERLGMKTIMSRRNYASRYSSWYDVHLICQKRYF